VGLLRRGALEELLAGGDVEEQIAHLDRGALRSARLAGRDEAAAVDLDPGARQRALLAGEEREARHGGDRGQRFAAEAVRRDAEEIVLRAQLAGRVPLDARAGVRGAHPAAVVAHADEGAAAFGEVDLDPSRPGVEGVLAKLLHRRGGALDHLASRDLVRERLGQYDDGRHWRQEFRKGRSPVNRRS
jgi:hypothetical protein